MKIDIQDITEDTIVWGYAYSTNNTEKSMSLICKPVKGMIVVDKSKYHSRSMFHELKKDGTPRSTSVRGWSRNYTDNEAEAIKEYDILVQKQIDFLFELIGKCAKDRIKTEIIEDLKDNEEGEN